MVTTTYNINDVLNRMFNWKMESAWDYAKTIDGFPTPALKKLKQMSDKFGNCGWQDGKIFDGLRKGNNEVAKILGYKFDDDKDYWIKIDNS